MKTSLSIAIAISLVLPLSAAFENWTNKEGKTAQLELVEVIGEADAKEGVFKMRNGRKANIKQADLAEADAKRLADWKPAGARVPAGFRLAAGAKVEPHSMTGWAHKIVHESSGVEMVYVPAGSFQMGSPAAEANREPGEVRHKVTLTKGFYLGKCEVTQGQWKKILGSTIEQQRSQSGKVTPSTGMPKELTEEHKDDPLVGVGDDLPMYYVSWNDAQDFCAKLGPDFRLPTEAEWEYACRAGTTKAAAGPLDKLAWTVENSGKVALTPNMVDQEMSKAKNPTRRGFVDLLRRRGCGVHPVGKKQPNAWGLHDMHGNVWEWCQDVYGPLASDEAVDPTGAQPAPGAKAAPRVSRGGSWFDFAGFLVRSACRECGDPPLAMRTPDWRGFTHGFRIAFSPEASAAADGR